MPWPLSASLQGFHFYDSVPGLSCSPWFTQLCILHFVKTSLMWIMLSTSASSDTSWRCNPVLLGHRFISLVAKNAEHFQNLLGINISNLRGWSDGLVVRVFFDLPEYGLTTLM